MNILLNKTKLPWLSYFYLFCIIIYAGNATVFARSLGDPTTIGNAFGLIVMAFVIYFHKIKFNNAYWISILIFLLYALITTINNNRLSPMWISQWLIFLTMSYVLCQDLNDKLFILYEKILYILCIIALLLWGIGLFSPSLLKDIVGVFSFSKPYGYLWGVTGADCNVLDNMIVYTLGSYYEQGFAFGVTRNPGFAWEPGAFSAFICLAIACNMIRTNFNIRNNRSLFVFLGALLSTQSTTGLLSFGVMVVVWLIINRKYSYAVILIPVMLWIYNLPFVGEKMAEEWAVSDSRSYTQMSSNYTMNRFQSFWLEWEEFLRHPIIGLGGYYGGAAFRQEYSSFSGLGQLFSRYGIVLASLFFVMMGKSIKVINKVYDSKNAIAFLFAIVGMMISYSLWEQPLYIAFWIYGIYSNLNSQNNQK